MQTFSQRFVESPSFGTYLTRLRSFWKISRELQSSKRRDIMMSMNIQTRIATVVTKITRRINTWIYHTKLKIVHWISRSTSFIISKISTRIPNWYLRSIDIINAVDPPAREYCTRNRMIGKWVNFDLLFKRKLKRLATKQRLCNNH